ncbi:MAG: class I SAM-dependent methyltransferase, partial [Erysipelotrichaceae bacterium]|nr:class I SAM-dependent methyltransferase [Erysipelotrichaceae bacterium]
MEGSAKSRNVSNCEMLAQYYDELLQDEEALSLWLKYIEEEKFKTVLELASGSGVMAGILQKKGYDVIASDISEAMKDAAVNNIDGEYLILNMTDYDLDRKFDLILCICDSINYLYENELDRFFECAAR